MYEWTNLRIYESANQQISEPVTIVVTTSVVLTPLKCYCGDGDAMMIWTKGYEW